MDVIISNNNGEKVDGDKYSNMMENSLITQTISTANNNNNKDAEENSSKISRNIHSSHQQQQQQQEVNSSLLLLPPPHPNLVFKRNVSYETNNSLSTNLPIVIPRRNTSNSSIPSSADPLLLKHVSPHPSPRLWGKAGQILPDVTDMIQLNINNSNNNNTIHGHDQSTQPPITSSTTTTATTSATTTTTTLNENITTDMEDVIPSTGDDQTEQQLMEELTHATPRVNVTMVLNEQDDDFSKCPDCHRHDCPTLDPPVGYYSSRQVSLHASPGDCWISANGLVYDVSRYITKHPGGVAVLLKRGGHDATEDYKFHSAQGKRQWHRLEVGKLMRCPNIHRRRSSSSMMITTSLLPRRIKSIPSSSPITPISTPSITSPSPVSSLAGIASSTTTNNNNAVVLPSSSSTTVSGTRHGNNNFNLNTPSPLPYNNNNANNKNYSPHDTSSYHQQQQQQPYQPFSSLNGRNSNNKNSTYYADERDDNSCIIS
jgi:cytochrome b involved in lipid metabolism